MDREILFRGRVSNNHINEYSNNIGKFVQGGIVYGMPHYSSSTCVVIAVNGWSLLNYYIVDKETLGQYTGLKDKNGDKIFEGDIIKVPEDWDKYGWNAGEKLIVIFDKGGYQGKLVHATNHSYYIEDGNDFDIIGNIHDNPELLKGE